VQQAQANFEISFPETAALQDLEGIAGSCGSEPAGDEGAGDRGDMLLVEANRRYFSFQGDISQKHG